MKRQKQSLKNKILKKVIVPGPTGGNYTLFDIEICPHDNGNPVQINSQAGWLGATDCPYGCVFEKDATATVLKIDIKDYQYGKITKQLRSAVTWLNRRKKQFKKYEDAFDYPDYWGMPKSISRYLTGDQVDFIQDNTWEWYKNG